MVKRKLAIAATLSFGLLLTGCGFAGETLMEESLRLGIECREAGGEWKLVNPDASGDSFKGRQFCEFKKESG